MKRYLRFFLIFVISLALPLSGMAGVEAQPCPMQSMSMAMMDGMGADCCNDMASSSKKGTADHGKPCKPGQECKSGGLLQVSIVKPPVNLFSPVAYSIFSDFLPVPAPSGPWRPPRI
jgi:hypothetical protein